MQAITLGKTTIEQLRKLYETEVTTPRQVVEQIIALSKRDEAYNIWITPPSLQLIEPYLQALETKGKSLPLWGIPFAVKDNIDVYGMPTTAGCEAYSYEPQQHAFVVQRLVDAGAIPIGKTNLDQFATGLVGTRSPYGVCKNAYDSSLISGGSSSGSAIAVARGHVPFALGTDTAGSGRVPAALNKLVGFKPSRGAWSNSGVVPACESLDCVTVFTQTTADALIIDEVVRAFDKNNGWSQPRALQPLQLPTKVLLLKQPYTFFGPYAAQYEQAWQIAIEQLQQLPIEVEYIDGEYLKVAAELLYEGPLVAERWASLRDFIEEHPNNADPVVESILRRAQHPQFDATSLFQAQHLMQRYRQLVKEQLQNAVLIMPTVGGTWTIEEVQANPVTTNSQLGLYTNHCNILDLCAINIPIDTNTSVSFGVTAFANGGEDHLVHAFSHYFTQQPLPIIDTATTVIAVCGLHLKGYPLEQQMLQFDATYLETTKTSQNYRLLKIEDGLTRPGLLYSEDEGVAIEVDLWAMPKEKVAEFLNVVKAPLALGKVMLQDGREVIGFVCGAYSESYTDITSSGGWRYL